MYGIEAIFTLLFKGFTLETDAYFTGCWAIDELAEVIV